jgi:hypothetical protein
MAVATTNVRVAITGEVYVAPTGTALPTTAIATPNVAFKGLGAISEDGIAETRDRTTDDIRIWQDSAIARTVVTESSLRFTFTMVETKKETVELFYGSAVTDVTGLITINPANTGGRKAFIIDVIDGAIIERTVIAEGEVTEVGDKTYVGTDAVGYEVTITAYTNPLRYYTALIIP